MRRNATAAMRYMAEVGRLTDVVRAAFRRRQAKAARIQQLEEEGVGSSGRVLELEQTEAACKAELAAAKVTLALRDDNLADLRRQVDAAQIEIDGQRVEIVALKTKLGNAEDELAKRGASFPMSRPAWSSATAASNCKARRSAGGLRARRDPGEAGRSIRQSSRRRRRSSPSAATSCRRSRRLRKELETRLASLSADLRKRDAAIADREGRLAFAAGREAELNNEIAPLEERGPEGTAPATKGTADGQRGGQDDRRHAARRRRAGASPNCRPRSRP